MKDLNKVIFGLTHGSVFHADDVFATALLLMLNPNIIIHHTVSVEYAKEHDALENWLVYDIGEGEYDHHQNEGFATRPLKDGYCFDKDGRMKPLKYCSFGILWRDYGRKLCVSEKAWKKVDQMLVLPIDKADNGVERNTLSSAIHQFNTVFNKKQSRDDQFNLAVQMASAMLNAYIDQANAEVEAENVVKGSMIIDDKILVLDKFVPWQDVVIEQMPDILYVVYYDEGRNKHNVQTVPTAPGSFTGRKLFPKKWLGNPDASLGMTFCHPGNFLLACETREQAINCAKIAVDT